MDISLVIVALHDVFGKQGKLKLVRDSLVVIYKQTGRRCSLRSQLVFNVGIVHHS